MDFGDWEGLSLTEIRTRFPEELDSRKADIANFTPPGGGESIAQLARRVIPCLEKILNGQKEKEFLILGHGGVNRVILCHTLGLDLSGFIRLKQDYGCLNIIDYYPDSPQVTLLNG
jgi:broad specificity phosphatase PhoE